MMIPDIQVIEKPDWVSWEEIKQCLVESHSVNRAKGINMAHYQWPVEKIREYIGSNGTILVALDGTKVVGTAAISEKQGKTWYANGRYAYMCFAGVLPEYNGLGIYGELTRLREQIAIEQQYHIWVMDTHVRNTKLQQIVMANGYRKISYFRTSNNDHFNIVIAKWPDGCPYSKLYCIYRFCISWIIAHLCAIKRSMCR